VIAHAAGVGIGEELEENRFFLNDDRLNPAAVTNR